jgi:hypothetical protein
MEKIRSFFKNQSSPKLVIMGVLLIVLGYFSPRYIGIIPNVAAMMVWAVLLGRAVAESIDKKAPDTKCPWWATL